MISFATMKAEHLWGMPLQPEQAWVKDAAGGVEGLRVLEGWYSHTLFDDGAPIAIVGAHPREPHRAIAWAYFRLGLQPGHMPIAVRWGRRWLRGLPYQRVEAEVLRDYAPGRRLVELLGFEVEAERLRKAGPDGADHALYAYVRD